MSRVNDPLMEVFISKLQKYIMVNEDMAQKIIIKQKKKIFKINIYFVLLLIFHFYSNSSLIFASTMVFFLFTLMLINYARIDIAKKFKDGSLNKESNIMYIYHVKKMMGGMLWGKMFEQFLNEKVSNDVLEKINKRLYFLGKEGQISSATYKELLDKYIDKVKIN